MAPASNRKKSSSNKKRSNHTTSNRTNRQRTAQESKMFNEIGLLILLVAMILLFCCNFGLIGPVGNAISSVLFGLFGFTAYVSPILLFFAIAFWYANEGNPDAVRKLISGVVLFFMLGVICELFAKQAIGLDKYSLKEVYLVCQTSHKGGGVFAGSLAYFLNHYLETFGTILVVILFTLISLILLTEKSFLDSLRNGSNALRERGRVDADRRREENRVRRMEHEEQRSRREEERRVREEERRAKDEQRRLKEEEKENEQILRMDNRVSGVTIDTALKTKNTVKRNDDVHEITYTEEVNTQKSVAKQESKITETVPVQNEMAQVRIHTIQPPKPPVKAVEVAANVVPPVNETSIPQPSADDSVLHEKIRVHKDGVIDQPSETDNSPKRPVATPPKPAPTQDSMVQDTIAKNEKKIPQKYMFPPLSRLQKGVASTTDSTQELKETALRLQQTLRTFGVNVTITDISQGPSVTRYELQPEQGVKVSKIVGLADDIKLNLAATDIRIEAPIPGKAAIGIEVPNKENMMVALRDLLESKEFRDFQSNIAFAVGKDIAGQTIVTDIAKMPHMLIAGSTGSGKSVCINTLIMSILYKAHPDDVKLIMVDPKVVELSVYNGIPHLLIPVVTDPKKASAALHWAVSEMEDRYRKFADFNVRDLKGYNKKLEAMQEAGEPDVPNKLPQIVIIVDELADLMMVSPGEVEESICRLAQLARACGIHLIIATQRPSVDVITGLIKANMPSRVAFAVSSGVDSRTILDMVGAEKLLGKGDMLFYPQGYSKPARIQGAFVSDKEVSDVVDFLKNQTLGNTYASDIEDKIRNMDTGSGSGSGGAVGGDSDGRDEYFEQAGRFIIDKDKASIGMLQRVLKVGFNRAARIMDQLCEYGVVGEEEGTKPRKVLMSMEQFEQLLEEI